MNFIRLVSLAVIVVSASVLARMSEDFNTDTVTTMSTEPVVRPCTVTDQNAPVARPEDDSMSLEILRQLAPPAKPVGYTIQKGDTLDSIAKAHGMTWEELNERNPWLNDAAHTMCDGKDLTFLGRPIEEGYYCNMTLLHLGDHGKNLVGSHTLQVGQEIILQ